MSKPSLPLSQVNAYLAHKQHLLPGSASDDLVRILCDIVALHATVSTGPYLSLWARMTAFERRDLDRLLYDERAVVRLLCMRTTLHLVPSHQMPYFFQAYAGGKPPAAQKRAEALLVSAGLCEAAGAGRLLEDLQGRVLDVLGARGARTVNALGKAVPELQARVRHDVGKPYEGAYSVGSRLVPAMCDLGLLVRGRPRGTWRSNLYEYAALSDWLPEVDLAMVSPSQARSWLVRRYLDNFGPALADDIQWWTGFSKGETEEAIRSLEPEAVTVSIDGLGQGYLMAAADLGRLQQYVPPSEPRAFLLPGLDPYIMGYQSRSRFLASEQRNHVFDRAGNAMPTVWIRNRVVGAWSQRKDGTVAYGLVTPVTKEEEGLVTAQVRRLETFLGGDVLPQRSHTAFTRALLRQVALSI